MLNKKNFAKRVTNNRKKGITIVHFYSADDVHSADLKDEFSKFTADNKGMYNIGAVNCDTDPDLCEKEGVSKYPTFRIYPPHPIPHLDLVQDGYSLKKLKKKAAKFIDSKVIEVTSVNHDTFIKDNLGKPKVLLFTESKDTSSLYKALSYNFDKTLFFGIVRSSESSLVKKYKVKEFPSLYLVKPEEKPRKYDGEINYLGISNFINVYSEIFDFGDSAGEPQESAASKPWMSEKLPELTDASSKDICFSKKGLCVILFNKEKPSDALIDTLAAVREEFISNLDGRGPEFSFMWVDANLQDKFVTTFEITDFPSLIVLNAGKRKKYMSHPEEEVTHESLSSLLSTITGGNGRFKKVKGNELPPLQNKS